MTAVDGREAVDAVAHAMAQGRRFGAILMDVNMPDVDGLQATEQIQLAWGRQAPPVIALTAAASAEDRARCEAAGMQDYLTKPLQVSALAQTLEKWIASGAGAATALAAAGTADDTREGVTEALMDYSRLNEFKEFDDEAQSMTREVVGLFLADAPRRLQAIEEALAAGDVAALSRAAHALKGAAGNIGAAGIQAVCANLEDDARTALPANAAERIQHLHALLEKTREALTEWA
jgi:CheY-like chemotaxis protein